MTTPKTNCKITIDSATMTNKMFELIEAAWLFGTKKLDAVIEPKSLVHALINFKDGSTTECILVSTRATVAPPLQDSGTFHTPETTTPNNVT